MSQSVLVTGATGYVAGWIVKLLFQKGYTVHAAVRNPDDWSKVGHLVRMAHEENGTIRLFKADLLEEGSYDQAMEGCSVVFHTASPFVMKVENVQRDLLDPALLGTRNVLESANRCATVTKVVLTSSVAAVFGDAKDLQQYPDYMANEEMWNWSSSVGHQPYSFSKLMAEKEAWKIASAQNRWRLVVINPALVIGPSVGGSVTSESFRIVSQLFNGTFAMGVPDFSFAFVDVRDVAKAHVEAAERSDADGRHIVSAQSATLLELAEMLRGKIQDDNRLPRRLIPKFLVWLFSPLVGYPRNMIRNNVGYSVLLDNSESVNVLNISYYPIQDSIVEMCRQMGQQTL